MVEPALVVVVGRADQRRPSQGSTKTCARRRPARSRRRRRGSRSRGERHVRAAARADARHSSSSVQLVGAELVGPHAGGVDHVRGADLELAAADRVAHEHAHGAAVLARPARRPRSGWRSPRRSARPRRARSAPAGRRRSGSRRRGRPRSGRARERGHQLDASAPSMMRWRSGLQSSSPIARGRGASAPSRRTCSGPPRCSRSGRLPSKLGTSSGSGLTRCGASFTSSERSSSASRTSPRSKFWR